MKTVFVSYVNVVYNRIHLKTFFVICYDVFSDICIYIDKAKLRSASLKQISTRRIPSSGMLCRVALL
jgi:hypothetical protein